LARLFSVEDAIKSQDQSLLFIKKVVAIAVSNLLYLRNAFPDIAFKRFICDGNVKLNLLFPEQLKNKSHALWFIKGLLDVFGGIEKKYVKELKMNILYKNKDGKATIEFYTFHFEYDGIVKVTILK
jgi:hypothetical protein